MYKKSARLKFSPLKIDKNNLKKTVNFWQYILQTFGECYLPPFCSIKISYVFSYSFFLILTWPKSWVLNFLKKKKLMWWMFLWRKKNNCAILIFVFWNIPSHSICCCYKISMCWIKQKMFWLKIWNPKS